jgi:hypothetical protein
VRKRTEDLLPDASNNIAKLEVRVVNLLVIYDEKNIMQYFKSIK